MPNNDDLTRYPLGSNAFPVFDKNVRNLDVAVNDKENECWKDRFGKMRRTWHGMEVNFDRFIDASSEEFQQFLINSGYQDMGDYGPGLEIAARNQIFWRDGELYRAGAALELPYTTTGDWEAEGSLFVAVGDAALRQDLIDPNNGSAMLGRGVLSVDSIADLLGLMPSQRKEGLRYLVKGYHAGSDVGGGVFYWDESKDSSDHNGGSVISSESNFPNDWSDLIQQANWFSFSNESKGCWIRIIEDHVSFRCFGAVGDGVTDDSFSIQNAFNFSATKYEIKEFAGKFKVTRVITMPKHLVVKGITEKVIFETYDPSGNELFIFTPDPESPINVNACYMLENLSFRHMEEGRRIDALFANEVAGEKSRFSHIYLNGYNHAFNWRGWMVEIDNVRADYCNVGFRFSGTSFDVRNSWALACMKGIYCPNSLLYSTFINPTYEKPENLNPSGGPDFVAFSFGSGAASGSVTLINPAVETIDNYNATFIRVDGEYSVKAVEAGSYVGSVSTGIYVSNLSSLDISESLFGIRSNILFSDSLSARRTKILRNSNVGNANRQDALIQPNAPQSIGLNLPWRLPNLNNFFSGYGTTLVDGNGPYHHNAFFYKKSGQSLTLFFSRPLVTDRKGQIFTGKVIAYPQMTSAGNQREQYRNAYEEFVFFVIYGGNGVEGEVKMLMHNPQDQSRYTVTSSQSGPDEYSIKISPISMDVIFNVQAIFPQAGFVDMY